MRPEMEHTLAMHTNDWHSLPLTLIIAGCLTASLDDQLETDDFQTDAGRFYTFCVMYHVSFRAQ